MSYLLAALPILVVLALMILLRWSGQRAGAAGWAIGCLIGALAFGLTPNVWWVSQARGLYLSFVVLAVLWPALFLYKIVDQIGGIQAIAGGLQRAVVGRDTSGAGHGLLLLLLAWAFSGLLEGLAGFGLPIAIVAPMLVGLGVDPVISVAAVATGHAWAVTFGDMGVIFNTLTAIVNMNPSFLAPLAGLMLGLACLCCGLVAARILGLAHLWPQVILLGLLMSAVQYALAVNRLAPLAALGAGLAGIAGGILLAFLRFPREATDLTTSASQANQTRRLSASLGSYASLAVLMSLIMLILPINQAFNRVALQLKYPQVVTSNGWVTRAGTQVFRPLTHPGSSILLVAMLTYLAFRWLRLASAGDLAKAVSATWGMAAPSSLGIIAMVGLSTLMEHCGMTMLLAQGLAGVMGGAYPVVSPLVGILGAFATGSNNNSNVLFAPLQNSTAQLLKIDPRLLVAAQTAGGSLGSMIAPAKIIVGCNSAGIRGRDGEVLRHTLLYGIVIGLVLGFLAWVLS